MHENCGVVAVVDLAGTQDVVPLAVAMAQGLQHRGQLGAGIAWLNGGASIHVEKGHGLVSSVLSSKRLQEVGAAGHAAIAHTRYATNALLNIDMVQPYQYSAAESPRAFAFAFNGNIANYPEQRGSLIMEGANLRFEGDTEIIGQTIIAALRGGSRKNINKVFQSLSALDGAYNIVLLDGDGSVYAVRDPHGFHPLVYARNGSVVAVASEDSAIRQVWTDAKTHDVEPGYLLKVSPENKSVDFEQLWIASPSTCFFESVYFADHRSRIDGVSVANARHECGKILAEMDHDRPDTDIVVPVPESAKIAANGYADKRGLRRIDAILKNPSVGRTFISPSERAAKAALKYDIDGDFIAGRSIVLMDDSLVRGTTMRVLAQQLRDKGASEIHLRLASPPIVSPCFYGIDFPTVQELMVRKYSDGTLQENGELPADILRAIADDLKVDSIKYVPSHAIPRALGKNAEDLCMACVTKQYPTRQGAILASKAENQ